MSINFNEDMCQSILQNKNWDEIKLDKDIVVIGNCEYILDESKEKEKKIMCLDLY